ncbi:hypothetical protein EDC04DRAFT_2604485 [Pisolithus marmoratus]|nr:hypothetical protein EDC04DRAFT_2604485 [Pisolithus marmoratus]
MSLPAPAIVTAPQAPRKHQKPTWVLPDTCQWQGVPLRQTWNDSKPSYIKLTATMLEIRTISTKMAAITQAPSDIPHMERCPTMPDKGRVGTSGFDDTVNRDPTDSQQVKKAMLTRSNRPSVTLTKEEESKQNLKMSSTDHTVELQGHYNALSLVSKLYWIWHVAAQIKKIDLATSNTKFRGKSEELKKAPPAGIIYIIYFIGFGRGSNLADETLYATVNLDDINHAFQCGLELIKQEVLMVLESVNAD